MTPSARKEDVPVRRTLFDLDSFSEVMVAKPAPYSPVESLAEAQNRVGNDAKKLLEILNEGLRAEYRRNLGAQPDGWFETDEEGEVTSKPFSGVLADQKVVNDMVLKMAKFVFGYDSNMTKEQRAAIKKQAIEYIKSQPVIVDGLKKNAKADLSASAE